MPTALVRRRRNAGLSQSELAKRVGISQQLISKMETGLINIKPKHAIALADVLHCEPVELLPELIVSGPPGASEAHKEDELDMLYIYRELDQQDRAIIFNVAVQLRNRAERNPQKVADASL